MPTIVFHPPANNERGPAFVEPLIASLISRNTKSFVSVGIRSRKGSTEFVIQVPKSQIRLVDAQLKDAFPGSATFIEDDSNEADRKDWWRCPLVVSPDALSTKTHSQFMEQHSRELVEPLEPLLESIATGKSGRVDCVYWIHFRHARQRRLHRAERLIPFIEGRFRIDFFKQLFLRRCSAMSFWSRVLIRLLRFTCTPNTDSEHAHQKSNALTAESSVELIVSSNVNEADALNRQKNVAASLSTFLGDSQNIGLSKPLRAIQKANPNKSRLFLLGVDEIATLWHPPVQRETAPRVSKSSFRELEPPRNLPSKEKDPNVVTLGRVKFRSENYKFGMDLDARRRHLYIIGKTGMGKTTLLQNILVDDINSNRGVAIFDPHGDLANSVLNYIPKRRANDVVLIDPSDSEYAISFNPLQVHEGGDKTLVADGVLTAFQKVFGFDESQAPRMIHIFRNCLLSLVESPNTCLLDVQRLLTDTNYRKSITGKVSNPVVREFWHGEFGKWKPSDRTAFIASLQNKLGAFTTNEKLHRILGQPNGKLDLRRVMDDQKILIVNLSKGSIGENASNLLGTLLVTCLQQAAMSRANIPEHERRDYSIIIDEFQNYATTSIATFLSEARKYRAHLILSHQYVNQLPEEILDAALGNCGSIIAFQLGAKDGQSFEPQFGNSLLQDNLCFLPKYHAYCKLLVSGTPSKPFSLETIPVAEVQNGRANQTRASSNSRWARLSSSIQVARYSA